MSKIKWGREIECFSDLDIKICYDSLSRKGLDNVMPIFYEEQVITWKLLGDTLINELIRGENSGIDFLDVGTGSGFWSILLAKKLKQHKLSPKILAIDKVKRAVDFCKKNMKENDVNFDLELQPYGLKTAPHKSVKVIFMNPPYHLYPPEIESSIPHHARGGSLGWKEFQSWLNIADYHLSNNGSIFFHHMCLGNEQPEFLRFIPMFVSGHPSILYYEILPSITTLAFLKGVYDHEFAPFIYETCVRFSNVYFTSGIIIKDGKGRISKIKVSKNLLEGKTWQGRIALHKSIGVKQI